MSKIPESLGVPEILGLRTPTTQKQGLRTPTNPCFLVIQNRWFGSSLPKEDRRKVEWYDRKWIFSNLERAWRV